jgi:hypothetical protein
VIWSLITDRGRLAGLARGARKHASGFGWPATVDQLLAVYGDAMNEVSTSRGFGESSPRASSQVDA